jgi:hypothetical protein
MGRKRGMMFFCECSKSLIDDIKIVEFRNYKFFIGDTEINYCPVCGKKLPVMHKEVSKFIPEVIQPDELDQIYRDIQTGEVDYEW